MGISRQEYWVDCQALLQGIFPTQGSNPHLLHLLCWQVDSLPLSQQGSPLSCYSPTLYHSLYKNTHRNSVVVHWLGLCVLTAVGPGSMPSWATIKLKIPQTTQHRQEKSKNKNRKTSINFGAQQFLWIFNFLLKTPMYTLYFYNIKSFVCFSPFNVSYVRLATEPKRI